MPRPSVASSRSRVYRHTVKRQLEASLTLAVLRHTIGVPGTGPRDRGQWVKISIHALADATLLSFSKTQAGLKEALKKGYLQRRKAGRTYEYSVRWRGVQN
jgi:hypothetical protein